MVEWFDGQDFWVRWLIMAVIFVVTLRVLLYAHERLEVRAEEKRRKKEVGR